MDCLVLGHPRSLSEYTAGNLLDVVSSNVSSSERDSSGTPFRTSMQQRTYNMDYQTVERTTRFDEDTHQRRTIFGHNLCYLDPKGIDFEDMGPGTKRHSKSLRYSPPCPDFPRVDAEEDILQHEFEPALYRLPQNQGLSPDKQHFNMIAPAYSTIASRSDLTGSFIVEVPENQPEDLDLPLCEDILGLPDQNRDLAISASNVYPFLHSPSLDYFGNEYEGQLEQCAYSSPLRSLFSQTPALDLSGMPPSIMANEPSFVEYTSNILAPPSERKQGVTSRRRYSQTKWEEMRPYFTEMYAERGLRLKDIALRLVNEHNFHATEQMYKKQIKKWGLRRNMTRLQKEEAVRQLATGEIDDSTLANIADADLPKIKRYIDEVAKRRCRDQTTKFKESQI